MLKLTRKAPQNPTIGYRGAGGCGKLTINRP